MPQSQLKSNIRTSSMSRTKDSNLTCSSQSLSNDALLPENVVTGTATKNEPNVNMNMNLNVNLNMDVNMDLNMDMNMDMKLSPVCIPGPTSPIAKASVLPKTLPNSSIRRIMSSTSPIDGSSTSPVPHLGLTNRHSSHNIQLPSHLVGSGIRDMDGETFTRVRVQDLLNYSPGQSSNQRPKVNIYDTTLKCQKSKTERSSHKAEASGRIMCVQSQFDHNVDHELSASHCNRQSVPDSRQLTQSYQNESSSAYQFTTHNNIQQFQYQVHKSKIHGSLDDQDLYILQKQKHQQEFEEMLKHQERTEFPCEFPGCHRKFSTSTSRSIHQRRAHAPPTAYVCRFCNSSFSTSPNLNKHIKSVHEKVKPFQCELCSATFAFRDGLQRHVRMVHDALRPYACRFCTVRFKSRNHMSKHIWSKHPEQYITDAESRLGNDEVENHAHSQGEIGEMQHSKNAHSDKLS